MASLQSGVRCLFVAFAAIVVFGGEAAAAGSAQGNAAVATAHPLATEAGKAALREGGNAFDAAVAIAAMLAVVEPYSSGLGGGGFWLLHRASDGRQTMVDARETAPSGATLSMYVDPTGRPIPGATLRGGRAAAIPGMPAGLVHLAAEHGRLPLAATLKAAIATARNGFPVDARYAAIAKLREQFLASGVNTAAIFLNAGAAPSAGFQLRQPGLATTLETIVREGRDGFYRGKVADELVAAVNAAAGAWRLEDLANYRIVERAPLKVAYRGATVVTAPLPSAGGVTIVQALNILEQFTVTAPRDPVQAHLVIEALRRGFQDRARYLGDSDFVKVPLARLLDKRYARERAAGINPAAATPSDDDALRAPPEARNTTHYSVIDADGNRVAATLSINHLFGGGLVAGTTGVLLNNEMDDFSLRPDLPNTYRLRGANANAVEPNKRPLSSMAPTFVEDEKGVLVLGAPGGARIASQVLLAILEYVNQTDVDLMRLVSAPRYHHQYWPDRVELEPEGFGSEWRAALAARKHTLQIAGRKWGNMQIVHRSKSGAVQAASDPRGAGIAWY
jgi:gamma-glutamyltranspeptidase / glutathione hydrolase